MFTDFIQVSFHLSMEHFFPFMKIRVNKKVVYSTRYATFIDAHISLKCTWY